MEEWIGQWWHRAVTRVAEPDRAHVQVTLEEMRRSIALLYRAGGGDAAVRVAPVADSRHGGPRGWLQRLAGSGIRVPLPVLDWETLALPAQVAVLTDVNSTTSCTCGWRHWLQCLNPRATGSPTTAPPRRGRCSVLQGCAGATSASRRPTLHSAPA